MAQPVCKITQQFAQYKVSFMLKKNWRKTFIIFQAELHIHDTNTLTQTQETVQTLSTCLLVQCTGVRPVPTQYINFLISGSNSFVKILSLVYKMFKMDN